MLASVIGGCVSYCLGYFLADEANRILASHSKNGFRSIFNGRDLTGWAPKAHGRYARPNLGGLAKRYRMADL